MRNMTCRNAHAHSHRLLLQNVALTSMLILLDLHNPTPPCTDFSTHVRLLLAIAAADSESESKYQQGSTPLAHSTIHLLSSKGGSLATEASCDEEKRPNKGSSDWNAEKVRRALDILQNIMIFVTTLLWYTFHTCRQLVPLYPLPSYHLYRNTYLY